jgi:hypothetical protein
VEFISAELRGAAAFVARVAKLPATVQGAVLKAMGRVGRELERHVKQNKLSGQLLDYRSGNMRRAVFHEVGTLPGGDSFARVGVDIKKAPQARIQELGGVIRPKRAKHLTIPLKAAQTANGVARFSARDVIDRPQTFGYVGTFTHNDVIFGKKADGGFEPLFALKDQVTIKGVGYLSSTAEEKKAWVAETINDAAAKAFKQGLEK